MTQHIIPPDTAELEALLRLLDDRDPQVTTAVQRRLIAYGARAVPYLRAVVEDDAAPTAARQNACSCLRGLRTAYLAQLVECVLDREDAELERAVLLLSAFGYPEIEPQQCQQHLDRMAERVRCVLRDACSLSDVEVLLALNTVLFEQEGLRGALRTFYAPEHGYLGSVLRGREGMPIVLSVIYMLVAERVGVHLQGIGMPLHFVVYHPGLQVFIDPFNGGAFISRAECRQFIEQTGFRYTDALLEPRSTLEILQRMMRNLIYAHTRCGQEWEAEVLQETLDTLTRLCSRRRS